MALPYREPDPMLMLPEKKYRFFWTTTSRASGVSSLVIRVLSVLLLSFVMAGCESKEDRAAKEAWSAAWDNAVVVKICRDGTYIYRLNNGHYYTGGFPRRIENIDTVCG